MKAPKTRAYAVGCWHTDVGREPLHAVAEARSARHAVRRCAEHAAESGPLEHVLVTAECGGTAAEAIARPQPPYEAAAAYVTGRSGSLSFEWCGNVNAEAGRKK